VSLPVAGRQAAAASLQIIDHLIGFQRETPKNEVFPVGYCRLIGFVGGVYGAYWCHGSAGVARFLLKAYDLSGHSAHLQAAKRAGRMVALGLQWSGTTQCHGLAGNLEVLIDIWQRLSTDDFLIAARLLGENLATYRTELGWPSEHPLVVSPDLMVGQAGVGAAFIRLSNPKLPHLISTNAFAAHCSRNVFA
jgi:lantibiotic modifying enzyme